MRKCKTENDYQNAENDNLYDSFQVEEVGGDIMMHEDPIEENDIEEEDNQTERKVRFQKEDI